MSREGAARKLWRGPSPSSAKLTDPDYAARIDFSTFSPFSGGGRKIARAIMANAMEKSPDYKSLLLEKRKWVISAGKNMPHVHSTKILSFRPKVGICDR
jgi:hypothetical protein